MTHASPPLRAIDWATIPSSLVHGGIVKRSVTFDRFTVVRYDFPPGAVFPMHSHGESQATLVLSGSFTFVTPDGATTHAAGDVALVPADVHHEGRSGKEPASIVCVLTPPRLA